ncbi:fumarate hydratase [Erysipelotrichaceae bacterium MTC7]|nr:fumarate hydratase [Erysipelotrichaceae bacterium MTC7]
MIHLELPLTKDKIKDLKTGDLVYLSGQLYTARDAAHKRLFEMIQQNQPLPFDLKDATIYYVGPTPTMPGQTFGSAGPTTSARMDPYAPTLYDLGVSCTIGKGYRSKVVQDSVVKNQAIYAVAIGGAGALLGKCVKKAEPVAFEDLGAEAILKLTVENFPITIAFDTQGNNLYED